MNQIFPIINTHDARLYMTCNSLAEAQDLLDGSQLPQPHHIVRSKNDLHGYSNVGLTNLYNAIAEKDIKKFKSLDEGLNRICRFLNPSYEKPAVTASTEKPVVKKSAVKKKAVEPKKVPTKKTPTTKNVPAKKPSITKKVPSAAQMFRELIMEGKLTDDKIFAKVQKAHGLDDNKRSYVKWYRNELTKKGMNPPASK